MYLKVVISDIGMYMPTIYFHMPGMLTNSSAVSLMCSFVFPSIAVPLSSPTHCDNSATPLY
jgi:hypothetical protein